VGGSSGLGRSLAERFASAGYADDGSPDRSGEIADGLAAEQPGIVSVIHHLQNRGYGAALRTGMAASRYDWICVVDGDNEYAVSDLRKMLEIRNFYRLIIAFRYKKLYSTNRIFISFVYNFLLRRMFRTPFRDVSTGIRTFHRSILSEIELTSDSPFIGAELAIKTPMISRQEDRDRRRSVGEDRSCSRQGKLGLSFAGDG
jgi:glycosyltransferase involved in cell wall biosynthesis